MRLRNNICWVAGVAGLMVGLGGCELGYNGAWTKLSNQQANIANQKVQQALIQQQQATIHTPSSASDPARFTTPSGGGAGSSESQSVGRFASKSHGSSIGAFGLYGHMPVSNSPRSSPLDSPENLRQVTFATEGADFDPDIDPTGKLMVYASTQHRQSADLYLKRVNGTTVTQLTNDPANDEMPVFSPDGERIAFASDRSGNWDIYLMDISGGQAVQVTSSPTQEIHPSFSPDGKQMVYCSYGDQSGQWELVVVDVQNPATKRFVGYGLFPSWSPVDNHIVFQRARERGTRWFSVWTINMVNGEGLYPTEIAASSNAAAITPEWSPDGRHIVFCTVIQPNTDEQSMTPESDVWLIGVDGSNRTNLTNGQFANLQPVWSVDGSVYFLSNRAKDGTENIWSVRPDRALRIARPMTSDDEPSASALPQPANDSELQPNVNNTAMVTTP